MESSWIILTTDSGIWITSKLVPKNRGKDSKMERVQIANTVMNAVEAFCGVRLFAEYTITLYLKKKNMVIELDTSKNTLLL